MDSLIIAAVAFNTLAIVIVGYSLAIAYKAFERMRHRIRSIEIQIELNQNDSWETITNDCNS